MAEIPNSRKMMVTVQSARKPRGSAPRDLYFRNTVFRSTRIPLTDNVAWRRKVQEGSNVNRKRCGAARPIALPNAQRSHSPLHGWSLAGGMVRDGRCRRPVPRQVGLPAANPLGILRLRSPIIGRAEEECQRK